MEMNYFFDFTSQPLSSAVQVNFLIPNKALALKLIKGNYQDVAFPIAFKQVNGKKLCDVLNAGYAGFFLISEKMRQLLLAHNLSGWQTYPINLIDKNGLEVQGYFGLSVIGKCGPTWYKSSEIIQKRLVENGSLCRYYKGIFFENWDGTDFFTPEGTYQTFITKKAADLLRKNKMSNVYLENLAEFEVNVRSVKPEYRLD